jgi:hypothetical protein
MIRLRRVTAALFIGLCVVLSGEQAQGSIWPGDLGPFVGLDVMLGTPSAMRDVFRTGFPGVSLRYIASRNIEFSLDYAFMDIEYYYPETASGPWKGPIQWSSMPDRFQALRSDWIFYHTKHFLAPTAWYVAPLDVFDLPLAVRVGAGPAISIIVPNEAARYYPGLASAFEEFSQSYKAYLGLSLRLGLEYRPLRFARLGVEYLFVVDRPSDMVTGLGVDALGWFERAGNFIFFAGLRL